jgi:hypothetical protein
MLVREKQKHPSAAKAAKIARLHSARLNRLLKKGGCKAVKSSGAKAQDSFCAICGPTEVVPLLQNLALVSFFSTL